jgi:transposase
MRKKKHFIRQEVMHLRFHCHRSFTQIRTILEKKQHISISLKSIRRWIAKYKQGWDLKDSSTRPHTIHYKITPAMRREVIILRRRTGWEAYKIRKILEAKNIFISKSSIEKIIRKTNLSRGSKMQGKRLKWVRWQREHPNSLWQIDHSDEQDEEGNWTVSIIDDCSRYSLALRKTGQVTTLFVLALLEELSLLHGMPREILTDNGSVYGGNGSGDNEFDCWCARHGVRHIRTAIHKPTTTGKVERLFRTIDDELPYCNNDLEYFRYRYNFVRPHRSLFGRTPAQVYFDFAMLF